MSEHWVYVACNCFRDSLLRSEPPVPRSGIVFDKYGNVMEKRSRTPEDDSERFYDWRVEQACSHDHMRLVNEIWWTRDWRDNGEAGRTIASGSFPYLEAVLDNGESFDAATVLATPELAELAIRDLDGLLQLVPHGTTRTVFDNGGNVAIRPVDYAQLPGPGFKPLNDVYENREPDHWDAPPEKLRQLVEIGLDGLEFVVRDHPEHRELLRAKQLRQVAEPTDTIRWSIWDYVKVVLTDPGTGNSVTGYSQGIRQGGDDAILGQLVNATFVEMAAVDEVPRMWTDDLWPLQFIRPLLEASASTGNPLVGYYSGSSLGYEQ